MPATGSISIVRPRATGSAQASWLLDPIVAAILRHVFAAEKVHRATSTTVPVLEPGLGRTKTGRLCGFYVRDDRPLLRHGPAHRPPTSTAQIAALGRIGGAPGATFTGFLQADGYAGFEAVYDARRGGAGPIHGSGVLGSLPPQVLRCLRSDAYAGQQGGALDRIAAFYAIEAKARFAPPARARGPSRRDATARRRVLCLGRRDLAQSC